MGASQGGGLRLGLALGLAVAIAVAALLAGYAGVAACFPAVLPGDGAWARGHMAARAFGLVLGAAPDPCIAATGGGWGPLMQAAVWPLTLAALAVPLIALTAEAIGWRLRLVLMAAQDGHSILAGPQAATQGIGARSAARRLWLMPDEETRRRATGNDAAASGVPGRLWRRVLQHRLRMDDVQTPAAARRIGLGRAGLIVAASGDDLANFRLARLALAAGFSRRLVVRLEQRALRALASDVLREDAGPGGAQVVIAAPSVMQARAALQLAMPGRFVDEAAGAAVHLVICGNGPQIEVLALLLARQGYGLETAVPRLTVLAPGDEAPRFASVVKEMQDIVDIRVRTVADHDLDRLDAELAALLARELHVTGVFCVSDVPETSGLLARRCEAVLRDLGQVAPPVVALDAGPSGADEGPAGGLVLRAPRPDLAEVEEVQTRLDARARAIHDQYLDLMTRLNPGGAPALPAQRPWTDLAERYREDNRAAADHMAYKLARCAIAAGPVRGPDAPLLALTAPEVDALAPVEHARWVAARRVAGWTRGPRDDAALTHPDLVPYEALNKAGQDKDRDQVALLPRIALRGGEGLRREWPLRPGGLELPLPEVCRRLTDALARLERDFPGHVPLLRLGPEARDLEIGRAVQAAGGLTELVLEQADGPLVWAGDVLALRRGAYRLRIARDRADLWAATPAVLAADGGSHDLAPS